MYQRPHIMQDVQLIVFPKTMCSTEWNTNLLYEGHTVFGKVLVQFSSVCFDMVPLISYRKV